MTTPYRTPGEVPFAPCPERFTVLREESRHREARQVTYACTLAEHHAQPCAWKSVRVVPLSPRAFRLLQRAERLQRLSTIVREALERIRDAGKATP